VAKLLLRPSCFAARSRTVATAAWWETRSPGPPLPACPAPSRPWTGRPIRAPARLEAPRQPHSRQRSTKLEHGIYLGGYGTNSDFEIAWNRISGQTGGRAIQLYGHEASDYIQHISIHDNEISEVDRDGSYWAIPTPTSSTCPTFTSSTTSSGAPGAAPAGCTHRQRDGYGHLDRVQHLPRQRRW